MKRNCSFKVIYLNVAHASSPSFGDVGFKSQSEASGCDFTKASSKESPKAASNPEPDGAGPDAEKGSSAVAGANAASKLAEGDGTRCGGGGRRMEEELGCFGEESEDPGFWVLPASF
jgi:hypothetical protein